MKLMPILIHTLTLTSLASCCNKDLEPCCCTNAVTLTALYDRQWQYPIDGSGYNGLDWEAVWPTLGFSRTYEQLTPKYPDGLRTVVYDDDEVIDVRNIPTHGGTVYLFGNDDSMLVYNNDTEYDVIHDGDEASEAKATTRQLERPTYSVSAYAPDAKTLTNPPDMLYHCYLPNLSKRRLGGSELVATMTPLVYTYAVRYGVDYGLDYVAVARGYLAGMAGGVWLWDGYPLDWRVSVGYDASITPGAIEAYVHSFGHPASDPCAGYGLNLELRLKNGRIITYDFDISDQMRCQPFGGVIMVDGICIPDSIGQQPKGGGFDVTVDSWGEFEDIPIKL